MPNRRYGPRIEMRRLNSSGQGKFTRGAGIRPPKEVNTRTCKTCGAKKGETCFVLGKRFIELNETHTTKWRKKAAEARKAKATSPDLRPMALDETYDK